MGTTLRRFSSAALIIVAGCTMEMPFLTNNPPPPPAFEPMAPPAFAAAPGPDQPQIPPQPPHGAVPAMNAGHNALEQLAQEAPGGPMLENSVNRELALAGRPAQDAPPPPSASTPAPATPSGVQAQDPEAAEILRKLLQENYVVDQEKKAESEELTRTAVATKNAGDFENAKLQLERAIQVWPDNLEARQELRTVNDLMTNRPATGLSEIERQKDDIRARIQQNHIEINDHIRQGERLMATREFDAALKEFSEALMKVNAMPYPYEPVLRLKPGLERYIADAKAAGEAERARKEKMSRDMAEAHAAALEQAHHREVLEFIAERLEMAFMLFDQNKFDECARMCDQILVVDPHYVVARELKDDAKRLRHQHQGYEFVKRKVEEWRNLKEEGNEDTVPYSKTVRYPSREEWAQISRRGLETGVQLAEPGAAEPDLLAINTQLEKVKFDAFEADDLALDEALAQVKQQSGLNYYIDPVARKRLEGQERKRVSFQMKDVSAKTILRTILSQYGLAYKGVPGPVIVVTVPERAYGAPVPKLHEVADIVARTMDWEAPKFSVMPAGNQPGFDSHNAFIPLTEKEPKRDERYDDIVALIKRSIAPGTWDTGTYSIKVTPTKQLLVYHSPQVQDELKDFLATLRSYTGTMVSITTRFLACYDDFLEEAGVDVVNQPAAAPYNITGFAPSISSLPPQGSDVNDFTGFRGPGLVIQEMAGTEYYDLRAQIFNSFRGGQGFRDNGIGNRLLNSGGIGVQFQWLGEHAAQQVMTAVHKDSKTTLLQAPRITVFNTQRAHIMVVQQQAYVSDYAAALTGAQGALDPTIGILMTGIVLDVRPIVSNDRKYVTIEMRPSLAELQTIRTLTILTATTDQGPFPANVQLPFVILQRAEATVVVPDRGSVLLSGFKDIVRSNVETQVPILGDIPILSFFFQRKGETNERRRLQILVTPEIIDLQEREGQEF